LVFGFKKKVGKRGKTQKVNQIPSPSWNSPNRGKMRDPVKPGAFLPGSQVGLNLPTIMGNPCVRKPTFREKFLLPWEKEVKNPRLKGKPVLGPKS